MRHLLVAALAAALLSFIVVPAAHAQAVQAGQADCRTPRRALLTWLANLQDGDEHPDKAIRCFDWTTAGIADTQERVQLARQFKRLLDARGHYVVMEDIPDETTLADTTRFLPFPNTLSGFVVVQREEGWVISAETIRNVPGWYESTFAFDVDEVLDLLPAWTRTEALGVEWWQWLALPLLFLIGLLVRQLVSWLVQTQGTRLVTSLLDRLSPELIRRAALPIGTSVAMFLIMHVFPLLRFGVDVNRTVIFGLRVAIAVSCVLIAYRLVDVASDVMSKRAGDTETKLDDQLVPLIRKSVKVVTVIVGVIFVLQNMEVDVGSLIAGASLGGLAFTLAARDTVANLFGSVSIFADQPFQVGDWVVLQGVEGIVEEVGMRSTRIRTFYRSVVSIPNAKVADGVIDNYGARDYRRVYTTLRLQYDTTPEQMDAFCDGVRAILAANPVVRKDYYFVVFSGYSESALEVMLYFFLKVPDWGGEIHNRHLIYLEILRLAAELRVKFAFPTRTLHVASQAKPTEPHVSEAPRDDELAAAVFAFGPQGALSRPLGPSITHGFLAGESNGAEPGSDPGADQADSRE